MTEPAQTHFGNQRQFSPNIKKLIFAILEILLISAIALFTQTSHKDFRWKSL